MQPAEIAATSNRPTAASVNSADSGSDTLSMHRPPGSGNFTQSAGSSPTSTVRSLLHRIVLSSSEPPRRFDFAINSGMVCIKRNNASTASNTIGQEGRSNGLSLPSAPPSRVIENDAEESDEQKPASHRRHRAAKREPFGELLLEDFDRPAFFQAQAPRRRRLPSRESPHPKCSRRALFDPECRHGIPELSDRLNRRIIRLQRTADRLGQYSWFRFATRPADQLTPAPAECSLAARPCRARRPGSTLAIRPRRPAGQRTNEA